VRWEEVGSWHFPLGSDTDSVYGCAAFRLTTVSAVEPTKEAEGEGALMNLTTLSTIAMLVNPTSVRVTAGILCAVFVVIIVMRRKKMASKRRPIP
jgi:hypothetical protein